MQSQDRTLHYSASRGKNRWTDLDEIWNADARRPSELYRPEKKFKFKKIQTGGTPPF